MLRNLYIRDFVIVEQIELSFESGFTVFSGETGAGKSILIDALSLALGGRTDTGLIREGADKTDISAVFDVPKATNDWLAEQSIDGQELILRRIIDKQGRSKAYINGIPCTLGQLRDLSAQLVDIHGQHAHQSLLSTHAQLLMLDDQAGITAQVKQLNKLWAHWQKIETQLREAKTNEQTQAADKARLNNDIEYLENIAPTAAEWPELCQQQAKLAHGQALLSGCSNCAEILDGESQSAIQAINSAIHLLRDLTRYDANLESHCESLESASILCKETVSSLNSYVDKIDLNPDALTQIESRMSTLFEAARRFQTEPELLSEKLDQLQNKINQLNSKTDLVLLEQQRQTAEKNYLDLAQKISSARHKTAADLSKKVSLSMQKLAMEGGQLKVAITKAKPNAFGIDNVEYLVAGHAGVSPRPLSKVVSGGELARISLALSVIASEAARVPTLIFDEVDTGIGGAVAEVVGKLLQQLGNRHQVLCVTHLPQVATCASHHYQVRKTSNGDKTISDINLLDDNTRLNEIARMLGGLKITETTKQHAQEMLKNSTQ